MYADISPDAVSDAIERWKKSGSKTPIMQGANPYPQQWCIGDHQKPMRKIRVTMNCLMGGEWRSDVPSRTTFHESLTQRTQHEAETFKASRWKTIPAKRGHASVGMRVA